MGALSDYICKSNEAVDKMVEIYIPICVYTRIREVYIRIPIYIYKIMDEDRGPNAPPEPKRNNLRAEEGNLNGVYLARGAPKTNPRRRTSFAEKAEG